MDKFINLATSMALKSTSKFRHGAVLVRKNRVISAGFNNMRKSHPIVEEFNNNSNFVKGMHAEIHACLGVSASDLKKSDVYVVRLLRNGEKALSLPCQMCQSFLDSVGVRRVYFSTATGSVGLLEL